MKRTAVLCLALLFSTLLYSKPFLPEKLKGNWFSIINSKWEISLFDSIAIYKSQVWNLQNIAEKDGSSKISLKKGARKISLYLKTEKENLLVSEDGVNFLKLAAEPDCSLKPKDLELFKLPLLKNDTAVFSGFIKNFNKNEQRTGIVYVNDVLQGAQVPFQFYVSDNGYFSLKIPHTNPQIVIAKIPSGTENIFTENIFIEPGKEIFQLIDQGNRNSRPLFMGENARVNQDLYLVKNLYTPLSTKMMDSILSLTPERYKSDYEKNLANDLNKLKEFGLKEGICSKTEVLWGLVLKYRMAVALLEYERLYVSALFTKNKALDVKNNLPIAPPTDSNYYSFFNKDFLNDPLGIMVPDYFIFINRLKNMNSLETNSMRGAPALSEMSIYLERNGVKFTEAEKEIILGLAQYDTPEIKKNAIRFP